MLWIIIKQINTGILQPQYLLKLIDERHLGFKVTAWGISNNLCNFPDSRKPAPIISQAALNNGARLSCEFRQMHFKVSYSSATCMRALLINTRFSPGCQLSSFCNALVPWFVIILLSHLTKQMY